ncbi:MULTISPECIES: SDR family NAD(P)-dependent oxidoreductase [unclassified Novosphingobium]|uniref:SDR family NAD(P)-dependent oxidoreductase n=1 Tax=unclassified Novosphingobium TaxID=2644732 RepID=UPI001359E37F|nr:MULTISPECIES: SDR family NAD(P)-dependent oxidoreductase [unclassified Novosphingobium]
MQRTILITGAGSGMGRELARRALARGDLTIAALYDRREAEALGNHPNLRIVDCDVASSESVELAFAQVDKMLAGKTLNLVIHCAGISPSGAVEVEPIEMLERTLNVNAVGTARVIKAALPRLRGLDGKGGGRILLFASLWGKVGGPLLSAYCASKHAIEAIVDSARRETEGQGVEFVLVEPGVVRTNMVAQTVSGSRSGSDALPPAHQALYGPIYARFARMIARESTGGVSVEQAADAIERAAFAASPATRYSVGKDAKAVKAMARLLPDRALDFVFRKMLARS